MIAGMRAGGRRLVGGVREPGAVVRRGARGLLLAAGIPLCGSLPTAAGTPEGPLARLEGPPEAAGAAAQRAEPTPVLGYRVVREYPHDPGAFTQGLVFHDGVLYESTGLRGESTLRRVDLDSGEVLQERRLLPVLFGEGAAVVDDRIVQLTWRAGVGFVYDRETFRLLREFRYAGEGWGITFDGSRLVMSDGSAVLRFLDPDSLAEIGRLPITAGGVPVPNLNELEWIDGEIWANLWTEDRLARIDPETGEVVAFVDLSGLFPDRLHHPDADVLNGIAWDPETSRIFVTGKKWPRLFEIEVAEAP